MEIERSSKKTFYPFQNYQQIHQHLQSVKMLRAYEIVKTQSKSQKWARLTRYNRFL